MVGALRNFMSHSPMHQFSTPLPAFLRDFKGFFAVVHITSFYGSEFTAVNQSYFAAAILCFALEPLPISLIAGHVYIFPTG